MKIELLSILRCPATGKSLKLEIGWLAGIEEDEVETGWLTTENGSHRYPIHQGVVRFVPEDNYASNFGMQWNRFARTQLDSYSGHPISADRFWNATGWQPQDIKGKWVLDVGCGSGRFAEVALEAGAKVVALDYSTAVDACYANLKHHPNLNVVQGDVYALPFQAEVFPYVYSLGVLQHTPDVKAAFMALPPMLVSGGSLVVDFYWNRLRTMLNPKYALRPITTRLDQEKLFTWLEANITVLLGLSQIIGRVPLVGRYLKRCLPVVDYTDIYPLSQAQLEEWALLDTFDMLAPEYDKPQSQTAILGWFEQADFTDVSIFHWGHLVGRGRKQHEI